MSRYITSTFTLAMLSPMARARGVDVAIDTITTERACAWAGQIADGPQWAAAQAVHAVEAVEQYADELGREVIMRRQGLRLVAGDEVLVGLASDGRKWSERPPIEWTLVRITGDEA